MRILIIYDSKSGNTEKMALAVAQGVEEARKPKVLVKRADETTNEDLLKADGIIVGSPTYYGQMSDKTKAMFDKSIKIHGKLEGKVGGAFTSSGSVASGAETTILSILEAMLIHGMIIQGRTHGGHYGAAAVGEPNEQDKENCIQLGKMVANLTMKLES